MASRTLSTSLLIIFNLLFFTLVTSTCTCPSPKPPTPSTPPKVTPPKPPTPSTPPKVTPPKPPTPSTPPKVTPPKPTTPSTPPKVTPPKPTTPSTPPKDTCPIDVLKLGACANVLNDLVHLVIGNPSKTTCCTLLGGLADLDAAVCLCTAIKANILGINLNVPISMSLLLNYCDKKVPSGFQCS